MFFLPAHFRVTPRRPDMSASAAPDLAVDITRWRTPRVGPARPLTPHEIRIVGMLAGGDSYRAVADRLGVSVNTVRNYIRSIYEKLEVHTKSEAVSKALRARLIS